MKKVGIIVGIVVLMGLVVGGVVLMQAKPKEQASQAPQATQATEPVVTLQETPEPTGTGNVIEMSITGSNFKFSPNQIKAKKGDTIKLTFTSSGGVHDFTVDEFDVQTSQLSEGEEEEVEFVVDQAGTFEFYCSVGNHRKMGMVGKLIVE